MRWTGKRNNGKSLQSAGNGALKVRQKGSRKAIFFDMRWVKDKGGGDLRSRKTTNQGGVDYTGMAPPFLLFLRRFYSSGTGIPARALPRIAYRGCREGLCGPALNGARRAQDGRAAAYVQRGVGMPLVAIGGVERGSAGQAYTIIDAMQTNAINRGSGQRGYWKQSSFFYFTLRFYQKDFARDHQKNRSGREQLTPSPLYSISIMRGTNTGRGQSFIARGWKCWRGYRDDLTLI